LAQGSIEPPAGVSVHLRRTRAGLERTARQRREAMSAGQPEATVQVESAIWATDARDLFDFEAAAARTRDFDLPRSAKITRVGGSLMPLDRGEPVPPDSEPLLQLCEQDGAFWVDSAAPGRGASGKKLWLVVKDLPSASYALSEGDVIRLGCSRFRVRQLVADAGAGTRPEVALPGSPTTCPDERGPEPEAGVCRICLDGDCDEQGPLIRPCACRGSIESVHLGCLRQWIRCRMGLLDEDRGNTCFVRQMDCDLCKQAYPSHVRVGGVSTPLVEVPQPAGPFLVLEQVSRSRRAGGGAGVLVASLAEGGNGLTFGRAQGAGFRVDDISISRLHARISFREGRFVLEDNGSRFGTLVYMRQPYALSSGETVSIQTGGAVVSFTLRQGPAAEPGLPDATDRCSECSTEEGFSA